MIRVQPKLTLVGAGPGDPDLITVKGLKALADADVLIYDDISSEALLLYVPERAPRYYVGASTERAALSQREINRLVVEYAFRYGHVVHLKSGDPFVAEHSGDEVAAADSYAIPVEVVPGLSSVTALTSVLQIPLTQRGVSRGFRVLNAAAAEPEEFLFDLRMATQSDETVVILSGLGRLEAVVQVYKQAHKADIPAVVIEKGTRAGQKVVSGTLENIGLLATQEEIEGPAIIVVGETVERFLRQQSMVHLLRQL